MSVHSVLSHRGHLPTRPQRSGEEPSGLEWAREIGLVVTGLLVYFGVRAATSDDATVAEAHARSLVHLERVLGIAREGDLQRLIIDHHTLVTLANWVYIWGHWPLIALSAVWLFIHRPDGYRLMRTAIFISGAIGMIIFLAYPVAPPRLTGLGPDGYGDDLFALLPRAAAAVAHGSLRRVAEPPLRLGPARGADAGALPSAARGAHPRSRSCRSPWGSPSS